MVPIPARTVVITLREIGERATPLPTRATAIPKKAANTRMMLNQSLKASKASSPGGDPAPSNPNQANRNIVRSRAKPAIPATCSPGVGRSIIRLLLGFVGTGVTLHPRPGSIECVDEQHRDRHRTDAARDRCDRGGDLRRGLEVDVAADAVLTAIHTDVDDHRSGLDR